MTRNLFPLALTLITASFFSGCAINARLATVQFDSPEAMGRGGEILGGIAESSNYEITADDTQTPPNFSSQTYSRWYDGIIAGGFGIPSVEPLDVSIKYRTTSPGIAELKWQILGEPRSSAKRGNFALSLLVAGGATSQSGTDSNVTLFGSPSTTGKYSTSESEFDLGLLFGYRFAYWGLAYAGGRWTRGFYTGTLTQTTGSGGPTTYHYNGILDQFSFNQGVEFNAKRFLSRVEYALAYSTSNTSVNHFDYYVGAEFGVRFGSSEEVGYHKISPSPDAD